MIFQPQQQYNLPDGMVAVPVRELRYMIRATEEYVALDTQGVDNWQGHDEINWEKVEERIAQQHAALDEALKS